MSCRVEGLELIEKLLHHFFFGNAEDLSRLKPHRPISVYTIALSFAPGIYIYKMNGVTIGNQWGTQGSEWFPLTVWARPRHVEFSRHNPPGVPTCFQAPPDFREASKHQPSLTPERHVIQ